MKKLLIIGSDYCTLHVAKEAKAMGLYVIVSDLMESSPTKEAADEAWMVSTTDIDLLCEKCAESGVSAVMFGASDFNIDNARQICQRLGLPIYCDSDRAWEIARDKRKFKDLCEEIGVPVAKDYYVSEEVTEDDLKEIDYPVVVKPTDMSGNRGMSYCHNAEELLNGCREAMAISDKPLIIERMLRGNEYNVHYLIADGEPRLLYFSSTHQEPGQEKNIYSFKCTTSRYLKQYIEEMNEKVKDMIRAAGCREGIVWIDCMRDQDGSFYALEMGQRFGGVMTYVPYEKVTGFSTIRWMIECALGVKHSVDDMPQELGSALRGCAASYNLFSIEGGEVGKINGLETISKADNVFIDLPKREGDTLRKSTNSGLIGIYGKDIEELCDTLEMVNRNLKILDVNGKNMIVYYDDYDSLKEEYYAGLKEFGTDTDSIC